MGSDAERLRGGLTVDDAVGLGAATDDLGGQARPRISGRWQEVVVILGAGVCQGSDVAVGELCNVVVQVLWVHSIHPALASHSLTE